MLRRKYHSTLFIPTWQDNGQHPHCLTCHAPAMRTGAGWRCAPCDWRARQHKATTYPRPARVIDRSNVDGDQLFAAIDAKLRGSNYSAEMREELRSEIAMRILSESTTKDHRRITIKMLAPAVIREIARPLFKMQSASDRFRHVSLDHRYGEDGERLEDRLVG